MPETKIMPYGELSDMGNKKRFDIKEAPRDPNKTTQTMTAEQAANQAENDLVNETGFTGTRTTKAPDKTTEVHTPEYSNLVDERDRINVQLKLLETNKEEGSEAAAKRITGLQNKKREIETQIAEMEKDFRQAEKAQRTKVPEKPVDVTLEPETPTAEVGHKAKEIANQIKIFDRNIELVSDPIAKKVLQKEKDRLQKELEKIQEEEKTKQEKLDDPRIKSLQENIDQLQQIIEDDKKRPENEKRTPVEMKFFQDTLVDEQNKLKKAKELFVDGEISPETKTQTEVIDEVALMALNPQNNKNMLESNHIMSYTKGEIKDILEKEKDPRTALKKYLINSLDNSIALRNEAKYGAGFMGKFKKFMNEGWGGALTKTAAGVGLIAGGLYSGMGILSPAIYGAGIRMAAEGVTQIGQEINEAFNKKSRKHLLENGKVQLEQMANGKIEEIIENPKLNTDQKRTQALMEFIDQVYAQEVKNLVEQDTDHLRRAEKLRRHAGWVGTAVGIIAGMPMDIDADKVSHFVNLLKNQWFDVAGHGHSLLTQLGTRGALESIAAFGGGSLVSYLFNRGTEGDERKFKLDLRTTKGKEDILKKDYINKGMTPEEIAATEEVRNRNEAEKDKVKAVLDGENIAERGKEKEMSAERKKLLELFNELKGLSDEQLKKETLLNPETLPTKEQSDRSNFAYLILLSKNNTEKINENDFEDFKKRMEKNYFMENDELKNELEKLLQKIKPVENEENKVTNETKEKNDAKGNHIGVWTNEKEREKLKEAGINLEADQKEWLRLGDNEYRKDEGGKWRIRKAIDDQKNTELSETKVGGKV